jgi:hypothetical protein
MMTMKVTIIVIVNYVMPVVTWTAQKVRMSDSEVMLMVARW